MKTGWEFEDLSKLLEDARKGNAIPLEEFTENNPFAKVDPAFTKLLVLRKFRVKKMPFMPHPLVSINPPNDEHFQWGISIVTTPEDGETNYSVYIPNQYKYTGLSFENDEVTIHAEGLNVKSNIRELHQKLREFHPMFDQSDLERAFKTLTNEGFQGQKVSEPTTIEPIIQNEFLGTLTYDPKYTQYENNRTSKYFSFELSIYYEEPGEFPALLAYVESQMKNEFYKPHLLTMESEMIALKNDSWLDEDEEAITPKQFRELISIESIVFYSDRSCAIYCNDGDLFSDHSIDISIDKDGNYESVTLAG